MQKQQSSKTDEEKKEDRVKNTIRMQKERSAKTDEKKKEDTTRQLRTIQDEQVRNVNKEKDTRSRHRKQQYLKVQNRD